MLSKLFVLAFIGFSVCHLIDEYNQMLDYSDDWELWKTTFNRDYESFDEEFMKFLTFVENRITIDKHNSENHSYQLAMNHFGDLHPDEFWHLYVGESFIKSNDDFCTLYEFKNVSVPSSFDWRDHNVVGPVLNQGQCGSCYAFSGVQAINSAVSKKTNTSVSLSEQEIVSCSFDEGNQGCNGGEMTAVFEYANLNKGLCLDSEIPYEGQDESCQPCKNRNGFVKSCFNVPPNNELALKEALYLNSPISVAIEADKFVFQFYKSGVITGDKCGTSLDHGVLLVGYGTEKGKDYWIVKNSWSETWGDDGYVLLGKSDSVNDPGVCGIAMDPSFPIV